MPKTITDVVFNFDGFPTDDIGSRNKNPLPLIRGINNPKAGKRSSIVVFNVKNIRTYDCFSAGHSKHLNIKQILHDQYPARKSIRPNAISTANALRYVHIDFHFALHCDACRRPRRSGASRRHPQPSHLPRHRRSDHASGCGRRWRRRFCLVAG